MGDNLQVFRRTSIAPRASAAGFTMIELMVTILVAAILAAVAIPSFETTINNSRLAAAANELTVSLQTARIEAMRYNHRTSVCLSENANATSPTCAAKGSTAAVGWITYVDNDASNTFNGNDLLLRRSTLPSKVEVFFSAALQNTTANNNQISYRADGFARKPDNSMAAGNIDVCIPTRRPAENIRRINLAVGSRTVVSRQADAQHRCQQPGN